jgi:hypothetical protein
VGYYAVHRLQCGLRPQRSYQDDAVAALRSNKSNVLPAVMNYVLGGQHAEAAKLAVSELEGVCRRADICVLFVFALFFSQNSPSVSAGQPQLN